MLLSMGSLVKGDEGCIGPSGKLLCLSTRKVMQHYLNGIIPYMFVHLLLLKSSMYCRIHDRLMFIRMATACCWM